MAPTMLVAPVRIGSKARRVERRGAAWTALADRGDHRVDPGADGVRDRESVVDLRQPVDLRLQLLDQAGQVPDERRDLVDERRERQVQELHDQDDRDDVHQQDRERPAHAALREPADRRIEQVHQQQPDDERPDGVARHPQQDPDEDRGPDQQGDTRRHGREPRRVGRRRGVDERGRGQCGDPADRRVGRRVIGFVGARTIGLLGARPIGLVHRPAD